MDTHNKDYLKQELLTTFVTCEGDLKDPQFNDKFDQLLKQLQKLLLKGPGQCLGVVKVEPWNSVRVTFTVLKEAALKLRQLAQQGDVSLSQLGILSVQLEGDQAIFLRITGGVSGVSQRILLHTTSTNGNENIISSASSLPETSHLMISNSRNTQYASSKSTSQAISETKPISQSPSSTFAFRNSAVIPKPDRTSIIFFTPAGF